MNNLPAMLSLDNLDTSFIKIASTLPSLTACLHSATDSLSFLRTSSLPVIY